MNQNDILKKILEVLNNPIMNNLNNMNNINNVNNENNNIANREINNIYENEQNQDDPRKKTNNF
jgi:hypothetical protein